MEHAHAALSHQQHTYDTHAQQLKQQHSSDSSAVGDEVPAAATVSAPSLPPVSDEHKALEDSFGREGSGSSIESSSSSTSSGVEPSISGFAHSGISSPSSLSREGSPASSPSHRHLHRRHLTSSTASPLAPSSPRSAGAGTPPPAGALTSAWHLERARGLHRSNDLMGSKLSRRSSHSKATAANSAAHGQKMTRRESDPTDSTLRVQLPHPTPSNAADAPVVPDLGSPLHAVRPLVGSLPPAAVAAAAHARIVSPLSAVRRASSQPASPAITPVTLASPMTQHGSNASRPPHHPSTPHHAAAAGSAAAAATSMSAAPISAGIHSSPSTGSRSTPASPAQRSADVSPRSPIASASPKLRTHYALHRHNDYAVPSSVGAHSPSKSPRGSAGVVPITGNVPPLSLPAPVTHVQSEEQEAILFSPAYVLPPASASDGVHGSSASPTHAHDHGGAATAGHHHSHPIVSVNSIQNTVAAQSMLVQAAVATAHVGAGVAAPGTGVAAASSSSSSSPSSAAAAAVATAPGVDEEFDPFVFIKNLPPLSQAVRTCTVPVLPARLPTAPKITLALDLDETLVHCSVEPLAKYDLTFPVSFGGKEYCVFVALRPHLYTFLRQVRSWFEVVVFTASQRIYADKLLNILDFDGDLVAHRVFRESCVCVDGNFLKDISVLGRDLQRLAIIDNSVQAFGFHLDNGIPILSWWDDPHDRELLKLLPFLDHLRQLDDVRPTLKHTFKLKEFVQSL